MWFLMNGSRRRPAAADVRGSDLFAARAPDAAVRRAIVGSGHDSWTIQRAAQAGPTRLPRYPGVRPPRAPLCRVA